ncbi:MAG: SDR family oxidoreductase [Candidatus Omnitrophica bacterium]|nr:SDR family oxidoreductase [Candidatus Omnitrophota bacterium]
MSPIPGKLNGQTALVTGAATGIGRGIALSLAAAGANVVVNYLKNEDAARSVEAEILQMGRKCFIYACDVSKEQRVLEMFDFIREEFGCLDILVNNAGIQIDHPVDEMDLKDWKRVIDVNLTGQFLCSREAVRMFKRQNVRKDVSCAAGKIICVSSVHQVIPWAGHANYAASKGGVMLMMKSIAQEVAEFRIRVNAVAPGAVKTPINHKVWSDPERYQELMKLIPAKRLGNPEEIGRAVAWLASDDSDYIHGSTLFLDGGMTLYPGFETGG